MDGEGMKRLFRMLICTMIISSVLCISYAEETDHHQMEAFGSFRASGDLSDGQELILQDMNVNKHTIMAFSADVKSFSKMEIGRKDSAYLEIDDTNIVVKNCGETDTVIPHGLTITNNINIRIIQSTDIYAEPFENYSGIVELSSNGVMFTTETAKMIPFVYWTKTYGSPYVKAVQSELTDCALSYIPCDAQKSIYVFSDSYVSFYSNRWIYYLAKDRLIDNILLNGYPGEGSGAAMNALKNLLSLGMKPHYIVWCMGMNDGSDSESEAAGGWVTARDELLAICETNGIHPVFATIPSVPTINNEKKNEWIRSSGYQYIDFAKAVGANASGEWYPGMIFEDQVHPSDSGAVALYGRVLTDFPQIAYDGD